MTTDQRLIIERITTAQILRGELTQRELGAAAGLDQWQINRVLAGKRRISATELGAISDALGVTPTWLLGQPVSLRPSAVARMLEKTAHPSNLAAAARRARELLDVRAQLSQVVRLRECRFEPPPAGPAAGDTDDAGEILAMQLRHAFGLGTDPVDDLVALVDQRLAVDVSVEPLAFAAESVLVTDPGPGGGARVALVLLDSQRSWAERRYSLARRIGQLLLDDAALLRADDGSRPTGDRAQARADKFAETFLAPVAAVDAMAESIGPGTALATKTHAAIRASGLAIRWGLPLDVAVSRMVERGHLAPMDAAELLSRPTAEVLAIAGRADSVDAFVSPADHASVEPPPGLVDAALFGYSERLIGIEVLERLWQVDESELRMELAELGWEPGQA